MHLPRFRYARARSRQEASALLAQNGARSRLVSGGTDLLPRLKQGLDQPELLVSLGAVATEPPRAGADGGLWLDGALKLAEVARSPEVQRHAPALAAAALSVGSNQIRQMGTLGGNLCLEPRCLYYNQSHAFQFVEPCHKRGGDLCYFAPKSKRCWAVFTGDTAPALLALDASVSVQGPEGGRDVPLGTLYTADALAPLALGPAEIVAGVSLPSDPPPAQAFRKHSRRKGLEFAAVTVAVALESEGSTCRGVRIAIGSVAPGPVRARAAEAQLEGRQLSGDGAFREAARAAAAEVRPIAHHGYSAGYLRTCLEAEVFDTLMEAWLRRSS
jgi:4-hydroxybenzoyl-CoA reductase beta subunit